MGKVFSIAAARRKREREAEVLQRRRLIVDGLAQLERLLGYGNPHDGPEPPRAA